MNNLFFFLFNQLTPSGGMPPRTRIAPVNQALVTSVRLRDPRLMRQIQSQMQNQQQQNNVRPFMNGPRGRAPPSATTGRFSPTIGRQQFPNNFPHMPPNNVSHNTMAIGGSIDSGKMNKSIGINAANAAKDENNKSDKNKVVQHKLVSKTASTSKISVTTKSPNSKLGSNSSSRSNSKSTNERTSMSVKISSSNSSKDSKTRKDSRSGSSFRSTGGSSSSGNTSEKKRTSDGNSLSPTSSKDKITLKSDPKITKSKSSSPSKLFKDLKSPSKHRNYIRRNRESSKSPTMNFSKGDQTCVSPIPPEPPRITEPIESSSSIDKTTVVDVVIGTNEADVKTVPPPPPATTTTPFTSSAGAISSTETTSIVTTVVSSQSVATSDTEKKLATSTASVKPESDTSKNLIVTSAINEVVHILLWISNLNRCINCNCCSLHLTLNIVVAVRVKFLCLIIKDNLLRSSIKQIVFYLRESNYSFYCNFANANTLSVYSIYFARMICVYFIYIFLSLRKIYFFG